MPNIKQKFFGIESQAILAVIGGLALTFAMIGLAAVGKEIPKPIYQLAVMIYAFYFGQKARKGGE